MLRIEKYVIKEIESRIQEFEDPTVYLSDLSYKLFESEYANGSYTCNSYKSIQWIKEYFEDIVEIIEYYESSVPSPFSEPEKFQLIIITYIADKILSNAIYNAGLDMDKEVEFTYKVINDIIEAL